MPPPTITTSGSSVTGSRSAYGGEGVGPVPGDVLVVGQIADGRAAGNEALVALREVLGMHDFGVEGHGSPFRRHHR